MPASKTKSRTFRRTRKRVVSGLVVRYKKKKPAKSHCAGCGSFLAAVPSDTAANIRKYPKTARRPERPFGGVLCSSCSRRAIIKRVRQQND